MRHQLIGPYSTYAQYALFRMADPRRSADQLLAEVTEGKLPLGGMVAEAYVKLATAPQEKGLTAHRLGGPTLPITSIDLTNLPPGEDPFIHSARENAARERITTAASTK